MYQLLPITFTYHITGTVTVNATIAAYEDKREEQCPHHNIIKAVVSAE